MKHWKRNKIAYALDLLFNKKSPKTQKQKLGVLKGQKRMNEAWANHEQVLLFKLIFENGLVWTRIAKLFAARSVNSIKSFVHASFRKIKKSASVFWFLNKLVRWPTFSNNSSQIIENNAKSNATTTKKAKNKSKQTSNLNSRKCSISSKMNSENSIDSLKK